MWNYIGAAPISRYYYCADHRPLPNLDCSNIVPEYPESALDVSKPNFTRAVVPLARATNFAGPAVTFGAYVALSPSLALSRGRSCDSINLKNVSFINNCAYSKDIAKDSRHVAILQAIKGSDASELIRAYNSRDNDGAFIACFSLHSLMVYRNLHITHALSDLELRRIISYYIPK